MMTTTIQRSAIAFLQEKKKTVSLTATDFVSEDDMFVYNRTRNGSESFTTTEDLDWDEFYFEVKLKVSFRFSAYHAKETREYPEEKELEIKSQDVSATLLVCNRWNDEDEEMQPYYLSAEERREIEKYFKKNAEVC